MPPISQVTGDPTILSIRKCHLEVMLRGLAPSMLHMSRSREKLTRALGCVSNRLGWGGKFNFTEDPSLVLLMSAVTGKDRGELITFGNSLLFLFWGTNILHWLFSEATFLTQIFPWGLWTEIRKEL